MVRDRQSLSSDFQYVEVVVDDVSGMYNLETDV